MTPHAIESLLIIKKISAINYSVKAGRAVLLSRLWMASNLNISLLVYDWERFRTESMLSFVFDEIAYLHVSSTADDES